MESVEYLIIGGGIAGTTAAETIRKHDSKGRIVLVSGEDHPLYSRVLLPHFIKGKVPREKVFLRSWEKYSAQNIEVVRPCRLVKLDPSKQIITLDDESTWKYEKLLIATGGDPILPNKFLDDPNVHRFRTIEDANHIREEVSRLASMPKDERKVVIVGGAFLALEFPVFFKPIEAEMHMIVRGPRYLHRSLDKESSAIIEKTLTDNGVILHKGKEVALIERLGDDLRVVLEDNTELTAKTVCLGVGLRSNYAFAKDAGIETSKGIIANEYLETNVENVWTTGDCAEFYDVTIGRTHVLGNWLNADMQGHCAGISMTGTRQRFENVSQYSTSIFGLVIGMVGDVVREDGVEIVVRADESKNVRAELFLKNDRLIGATMLNVMADRGALVTLIKNKQDLSGKMDQLADSSIPLSKLLK